MMGAAQIKEELHRYINKEDRRLLKILYTDANEYTDEDSVASKGGSNLRCNRALMGETTFCEK
jgi:hypothetical protein